MGNYIASEVIKLMAKKDIRIKGASILVLGITFKENCPDVRNTRVVDVINNLKDFGTSVTIYDPWADQNEVSNEYQLDTCQKLPKKKFDAIILAVSHNEFSTLDLRSLLNSSGVLYDVKGVLKREIVNGRL